MDEFVTELEKLRRDHATEFDGVPMEYSPALCEWCSSLVPVLWLGVPGVGHRLVLSDYLRLLHGDSRTAGLNPSQFSLTLVTARSYWGPQMPRLPY